MLTLKMLQERPIEKIIGKSRGMKVQAMFDEIG